MQQMIIQQKKKSKGAIHRASKVLNNIVNRISNPSTLNYGDYLTDNFKRLETKNSSFKLKSKLNKH